MTTPQLTTRQSYWLEHYNLCKEQNVSFEAYCRQNNLSSGAFGHARKALIKLGAIKLQEIHKPAKKPGFAAVMSAPKPHAEQVAQIVLPGQIKIEVPLTSMTAILQKLLQGGQHD